MVEPTTAPKPATTSRPTSSPTAGPTSASLTEAVRAISRMSRFVERASESLSSSDYRVMSAIVEGEARASRLAARLALGKPAISSTVESLHKRGLIVKSSVEGDNRAVALALSPEGAQLFAQLEARLTGQLEQLAARTPNPEVLLESLGWLGTAIEGWMQERSA